MLRVLSNSIVMVLVAAVIITFPLGCTDQDNKTLFEKFGNGLDTLSSEGATDLWNMSVTKDGDTVTVLESFYNDSSIWIGFRLSGEELISNGTWALFYYNGEMIGAGSHGGILDEDVEKTWIQYKVMQPNSWFDVGELPDEFILEFVVEEAKGLERTFEFKIPLKRSDREVISPR